MFIIHESCLFLHMHSREKQRKETNEISNDTKIKNKTGLDLTIQENVKKLCKTLSITLDE